jgi:hypothetical protein
MTSRGIRVDPYPITLDEGLHYAHDVCHPILRATRRYPTLVP